MDSEWDHQRTAVTQEINRIVKLFNDKQSTFTLPNRYDADCWPMSFIKHDKFLERSAFSQDDPVMPAHLRRAKEYDDSGRNVIRPPPPGFTPTPVLGFARAYQAQRRQKNSVNGPSWLSYPANAVIFSQKQQNSSSQWYARILPVPFIPGSVKSKCWDSVTYLALESIKMIFQRLGLLHQNACSRYVTTFQDELPRFDWKWRNSQRPESAQ